MPIKVQGDLPAKEILERENIFVMDENRAIHQDIRPIQILIVNLMPLKEETELQLLRSLSNTPLQIDVTFLTMNSHESKNTSTSHLNKFYLHFQDVKENKYDGMIVTGAPVENMEFEEVDYWKEITEIMDWSETHVTSTIFLCWAAQASLYHFYGLKKRQLPQKMFGLFWHRVLNRKIPLVRGFDDVFLAPHSRHTEVSMDAVRADERITVSSRRRAERVRRCTRVYGLCTGRYRSGKAVRPCSAFGSCTMGARLDLAVSAACIHRPHEHFPAEDRVHRTLMRQHSCAADSLHPAHGINGAQPLCHVGTADCVACRYGTPALRCADIHTAYAFQLFRTDSGIAAAIPAYSVLPAAGIGRTGVFSAGDQAVRKRVARTQRRRCIARTPAAAYSAAAWS